MLPKLQQMLLGNRTECLWNRRRPSLSDCIWT